MELSRNLLQIMQHALGLDEHGRPIHRTPGYSRNYFACDPDPDLESLVALGLMTDRGAREFAGGMHFYVVTDAGKAAVLRESPPPPRVSRSRQRYLKWLTVADYYPDWRFGDWIRAGADRREMESYP